jgi:hypothetical protein
MTASLRQAVGRVTRSLLAALLCCGVLAGAAVGGVQALTQSPAAAAFTLSNGYAAWTTGGVATVFNVSTLANGAINTSTLSIVSASGGSATANSPAAGYISYTPPGTPSGSYAVTFSVCPSGSSTGCPSATITYGQPYETNMAYQVPVLGGTSTQTVGLATDQPAGLQQGATTTYDIAAEPASIPSSDSGFTVTNTTDFLTIVPVPSGLTYQSTQLIGGDQITSAAGNSTVTYCTSFGQSGCLAATGSSHGTTWPTTVPYVQYYETGAVPGGQNVSFPTLRVTFTVSGAGNTVANSQLTQFDTTANISGLGAQTIYSYQTSSPLESFGTSTILPIPAITSVSPSAGPTAGGNSVTIGGSGFTGATAVKFGGTAATSFTVNSSTSITATVPAGSVGTVDTSVTTPGGSSSATSADHYTYVALPVVTGVSPTAGPSTGGTSVTVSGSGFTGASAVKFGGTAASGFTVNSDSSITATAPAGSGTVDVTVTTTGGTSATGAPDQYTYVPAPSVSSVSPTTGSTNGGASVSISGSNFTGATAVSFGSTPATSFTVNGAGSISATAPAHAAGTVDVTVTTTGGTSPTGASDHFTYVSPPAITAVAPTTGSTNGGTSVSISGTTFSGATAVTFGGTNATSFTVNSGTSITATAPAGTPGTVDVEVTTPYGTSSVVTADHFTYVSPPSVTTCSPTSGSTAGGTSVTCSGASFTGATAVRFGVVGASSFSVNNDGSITASSPPQVAGTVDIRVTTAYGTSAVVSGDQFTYQAPAYPVVTGVSPTTGPTSGATSVTVSGSGFSGATAVSFGSRAATSFTVNSDSSITATSPAASAGTVDIRVTNGFGTSGTSSVDQFTYVAAPSVSSVNPSSGTTLGGGSVTISGATFTGATAVSFGGTPATGFTVNSDSSITATVPAGSAGTVDVRVTTPYGTSSVAAGDHYTYVAPPAVTGVSPSSGPVVGGTTVTVSGSGFTGSTSVSFGGTTVTSFTINSSSSITVTAPAGGAGTVDVRVNGPYGSSATSSADHFTYVAAPAVSSVSPNTGSSEGGTSVTISGSAFTGATAVKFGGVAATSVTVNSDSSISATSPAGSPGTVDVQVYTPYGTSSVVPADRFTYVAAPAVTGVSPASGTSLGGTSVTISGSGFTGATSVTFGGTAASSYVIYSATQIVATSPAESAGTVDVQVTGPYGYSPTNPSDQYTFVAPTTPAAPTGVAALPNGTSSIIVTWNNESTVQSGGVAVDHYTVTCSGPGCSAPQNVAPQPGGTSGTAFSGLTVGTVYSFTVSATNVGALTGPASAPVSTSTSTGALTVTPTTPSTTVGATYSGSFSASGGTAPYKWRVASGALPPGIKLSTAGALTGSATHVGTYSFAVKATDSARPANTGQQAESITVGKGTVSIALTTNPAATSAVGYGAKVVETAQLTPSSTSRADAGAISFTVNGTDVTSQCNNGAGPTVTTNRSVCTTSTAAFGPVGTYSLGAAVAADTNYPAASATPVSFTSKPATVGVKVTTSPATTVSSGTSVTATATLSLSPGSYATPTLVGETVYFTTGSPATTGNALCSGTITDVGGVISANCTFDSSSLGVGSGKQVWASYNVDPTNPGGGPVDTNYGQGSGKATISVTA